MPPGTASQEVCGLNNAILSSIHFTAIRSFHDLEVSLLKGRKRGGW